MRDNQLIDRSLRRLSPFNPSSMSPTQPSTSHRPFPVAGTTAMAFGVLLAAAEMRSELLLKALGFPARAVLVVMAVGLSVWGLKELIAYQWSKTVRRPVRARSNRFMMPVEGMIYCVIMLVLLSGSVIGRSNTLMLVYVFMAGAFIVNGSVMFMMLKHLSVHRTIPRRVMAGEPFSVQLTLTNPKRWLAAWVISIRDDVSNGRESLHPEVLFAHVARRSSGRGQYQLRLSQRGQYTFGAIQVNSRFPMGLVERGLILAAHDQILVYPRIGRLTSGWRRKVISATQLASHAQQRIGTFHDEFHRIREYRHGDDPRNIHWRTTARRNELMVREYRESRDRQLILLLDLFLPHNASEIQRQRFEYMLSFAATICDDQLLNGRDGDLVFAANAPQLQVWKGTAEHGGRDELLDVFALMQPNLQADLPSLLNIAREEQTPHSRTVVITSMEDRAEQVRWEKSVAINTHHQAWAEPPQVIVADPTSLAMAFSVERLASA
ncbi:MAG: DUF58 domain-containing protein [Planctomycetaceae bacterium]|nr:DUF58 domain-containing protein [Planctomycetaceae bacterium]